MMTTWLAIAALAAGLMTPAQARPQRTASGAKYVFFFLGDGMSATQIQATEAYLATVNSGRATNPAVLLNPANRLNMSKLPVQGMQTTYDDGALMTDSASSATAFACGEKTKSGIIGKNTAKTKSYKSVAQLAREAGKSVGVLSSVSLDHATPAAYYASVNSRGEMNSICQQLAVTGYEFFGGGGLAGTNNMSNLLTPAGYTIKNTRASILDLTNTPVSKVFCVNPWLQDASAMPYEIDRPDTNVSLKEMTEVAIACLKDDPQGFFIMVEGGKIDWACHANDAMATIGDMLDFDAAVGAAVAFYNAHPNDTLIIVTGDHETGGMTIGHATTGYTEYYSRLLGQTVSFQKFNTDTSLGFWKNHESTYQGSYVWGNANLGSADPDAVAFTNLMVVNFGLNYTNLNDYQKQKLEDAYDWSMAETNGKSRAEWTFMYSDYTPTNEYFTAGYEPVTMALCHILNERASVGWTSYSHTGVPVPVFACGFDAYRFEGFYDNTDIAKQIAAAMRYGGTLPVEK
jgi:alkaline phosphatase